MTIGQFAAFSIRQAEALKVCSASKAAIVEIVDAANVAVTPRKWWQWK